MAWKTEKWLSEVFPGKDNIYAEYRSLPQRELAIVSAGVLDVAIAELLSKRLVNNPKEYEDFLGLDETGNAPAGNFGARIQLALLVGLIEKGDAAILRTIKKIRNKFAHRINVNFTSPQITPLLHDLLDKYVERMKRLSSEKFLASPSEIVNAIRPYLAKTSDAGTGLLLAVFCIYQAYFHRLSDRIKPISSI